VLKLFKTPNDQKICYPFAGSGSEIIGGLKAGFSNWTACEINEDYIKIAEARIKHYTTNEYVEVPLFEL
jgi:DNA modification methylase